MRDLDKERKDPTVYQWKIFGDFIRRGRKTVFGADHDFDRITDYPSFCRQVPVREYDDFEKYINIIKIGRKDVLWPGKVNYLAQSSGTSSSKSKHLPVTEDSLKKCHYFGMIKMLATYLHANPKSRLFTGKALTLGGSVTANELVASNRKVFIGDLSAIMLSKSPAIAEIARCPKKEIALLSDFNKKVDEIAKTCSKLNVTSISGVPSWNLVMLKRILEYNSASNIYDIWPDMELFMHGGISMEPYWKEYRNLMPDDGMHYVENYNASEGYFAFQDQPEDRSMLLCCNNSVFYEFVRLADLEKVKAGEQGLTHTVDDVETGIQYAMIITTNAGLWRYVIGDTVEFTSLRPHKIKITGRTKLFINTFGEELMISNAEHAIEKSCALYDCIVREYTVAPIYMKVGEKGGHQWVIEFSKRPADLEKFAASLDKAVCSVNSDYEAKRKSNVIQPLSIVEVPADTFMGWMESRGKVGGQNKVPRLSGNRDIIESLLKFSSKEA